jgi:hypothetical protein
MTLEEAMNRCLPIGSTEAVRFTYVFEGYRSGLQVIVGDRGRYCGNVEV